MAKFRFSSGALINDAYVFIFFLCLLIRKNLYLKSDYVIEKLSFRIHTIRTDIGHEFQAQFHKHVKEKGIRIYLNQTAIDGITPYDALRSMLK